LVESSVFLAERKGFARFEFVDRPADHPLGNTALRAFDLKGYAMVSMIGCASIYASFLCFLGPAFVTGAAVEFDPENLDTWVMSLEHASSLLNLTNESAHPANFTHVPA
jgi:hypothetical protein